ncbi:MULTISPECIES: hypothetical protein [unclassified Sphingomonas]|jgi:hypothetical protein|uniref:hypothetical protein n=1 Tax=unclassified Sphingomonas TaxID=196159 RepID=UPI000E1011AC|nr:MULTISPECIES: hypothetical protein [unclassified Sphingomonas]AXJ94957.1 hypothetical protein DM480_04990 [Sphingomonas sp. FARSPH]
MTVLDDMLRVHAFRQLLDARDDHEPGDISGVLRGGWDVWERPEDLDLTGVARLPHLAILSGLDLRHTAHRPVLAMDMGRTALNAGFWRQLNILPNSDQRRRDERHDASDPFAPIDGQLYPERAAFLRAIFGHTPADIVEFLVCLREKDKQTARLLLAKDFKAALAGRSALIEMPWPDAVRARWSREGGGDHLPPVLAVALYAEAARLSRNMTAHIRLSFDEHGQEIFSRSFLELIPKLGGAGAPPSAIGRLVELAPLQTTALLPPSELIRSLDTTLCGAWSEDAASAMANIIALGSGAALETFRTPESPATAEFIGQGIAAHPRFWREHRTGHGWSMQKGHPATWWGLAWRMHGAAGLLDLAAQARKWSARHRTGHDRLTAPEIDRPLERAIAAVLYCWVETAHPAALATALAPVIAAKEAALSRATRNPGVAGQPRRLAQEDRTIDALATGESFGSTLCAEARGRITALPAPGEEGYTARYRAHLWLDGVGDDIAHYLRHQRDAIQRHKIMLRQGNALLREHRASLPSPPGYTNPRRMSVDPHLTRRRYRRMLKMTKSKVAPRTVQDCAMMMLPPATDPIHVVNAAPHRWASPGNGNGDLPTNPQGDRR